MEDTLYNLHFSIRFIAFAKEYKFNVTATSIEEAISEIEKTHPIMPNEGKRNYYVEGAYKLIETENSKYLC